MNNFAAPRRRCLERDDDHPKENAADARFKAMDASGDDKLSPDEHFASAKKMFDTMDANKDGTVTPAEMDAAHEKVTGKRPRMRVCPQPKRFRPWI